MPLTLQSFASGDAGSSVLTKLNANLVAIAAYMPTGAVVGTTDSQTLTNKTITAPIVNTIGPNGSQQHTIPAVASDTLAVLGANQVFTGNNVFSGNMIAKLFAPRGFMINGKFTVTDTGSGITIALKTIAGTDPSASDPVYIRIGDTLRSVTSALSRVIADGTSWANAGSAELATKEIDWALYAVWDSNSSAVALSPSRIFHGNLVSDFSATTTNEKHLIGYSDYTATDEVEVIGRFAATLSAGAGYTWSLPTYDANNLIQRPIYETRLLTWVATYTCSGSMTFGTLTRDSTQYKVTGSHVQYFVNSIGTTGGVASNSIFATTPWSANNVFYVGGGHIHDSANVGAWAALNTVAQLFARQYASGNWTLGAGRGMAVTLEIEI